MTLRKTLIFSVMLHLCFFVVFLFMSAVVSGRNGVRTPDEKVFFVKLTVEVNPGSRVISAHRKDESTPDNERPAFEKKKPGLEKSLQVKVQKTIAPENQDKTMLVKPGESGEYNNDLHEQEETADNVLPVNYETAGDEVIDISNAQGTAASVSNGPVSPEGKGGPEKNKEGGLFSVEVFDLIRGSIERVKTYPLLARKMGIEGAVHISFRINPDGEPQNLKILKSSGSDILDTATLDIVKKAAPFPYIESIIEVPIVFRLN